MLYAAGLRRCYARSLIMGRGLAVGSMSQPMKTISLQRNVILSAITRSPDSDSPKPLPLARQNFDDDRLELDGKPDRKRASLHIANIPFATTDEEFRQAFSVVPGIVNTELVFNSGTMRDYKNTSNRGFGFLHFESELAASAAMKQLRMSPVRIQGFETEVKPNKSKTKSRNDVSHVLHISGLPLDIQYLEVLDTLKEKCPSFKSLRFMAGEPDNFLGVAAVAFEDTVSAEQAKDKLLGVTLAGTLVREHNISFGRPLYVDKPTDTLMVLGTPTSPDAAYDFRRVLDSFDCIERYKLIKDRITDEFRGFTTVNCGSVDSAWMMLEWFNREYPHYRVAFITSGPKYEQERKSKMAEGAPGSRAQFNSRPERYPRRDSERYPRRDSERYPRRDSERYSRRDSD
ncbi:RNA recognition motif protein [Rhizoctonia solani AG-3 Rhs1AP]|uniref:RNA recognition motif protein n=1 Tax=Rhizoctonia solani AG-3 Rhs1AP TaxID=1086054 RepID=X8JC44_9AGAM|nr:RNA recognition motif protein [Rhizoctonia solani AG-3 Rhs1AP]